MQEIEKFFGAVKISLLQGDITRQEVQAIVNAANSGLVSGGGVDGAIHRAGGPSILAECKEILLKRGRLPAGEAVITSGGNLAAKYVIHTVGPIWRGGTTNEAEILGNAYRSCLELAIQYEIESIAFPSISTGAYGYPTAGAAKIAIASVKKFCKEDLALSLAPLKEIRFVLFDRFALNTYESELSDCIS